uniref:Uncharacterized protein n=1 Tax=Anguilla anguilla TaxID=7936 RepID=A0A0E9S7F1_ANGAN
MALSLSLWISSQQVWEQRAQSQQDEVHHHQSSALKVVRLAVHEDVVDDDHA